MHIVEHTSNEIHYKERVIPAENFMSTLFVNVDNKWLSDKAFRELVANTIESVMFKFAEYEPIKYEIIDHGIENPDFFQGCGVSFTDFDICFTGIGDNPREALEDALEQAAGCGWYTDKINNDMPCIPSVFEEYQESITELEENDSLEMFYHVSLRLKERQC